MMICCWSSYNAIIHVGTAGVSRRSEALWREALLASRQASLTSFFSKENKLQLLGDELEFPLPSVPF